MQFEVSGGGRQKTVGLCFLLKPVSVCERQEGGLFCVLVSRCRCPARMDRYGGAKRVVRGVAWADRLPSAGRWFLVANRLSAVSLSRAALARSQKILRHIRPHPRATRFSVLPQ